MARKYEEVKGYWVYSIQIKSNGKYYIGVSKQKCCNRWNKSSYKSKSLAPYLEEWDSMEKTVLVDNLTKEEAYKYEDNIIRALSMNNLCINNQRSGLITDDINAYYKEYYENNKEHKKEYQKQYRKNNKEYQKQYQKQYYENNKEKKREYNKEYYERKKLEKQQNSLPLT